MFSDNYFFRPRWPQLSSVNWDDFFEPQVDIDETPERFLVEIDVPGMRGDELKMELIGRTLTVSGERRRERESRAEGSFRSEKSHGKFSRSFTVPESVDTENIQAHLDRGVLHLTLPKGQRSKARSLQINEGSPIFTPQTAGSEAEKSKLPSVEKQAKESE